MSVRAHLSVPAQDFLLGGVLASEPTSCLRFERVVPLGDAAVPYLWVSGPDVEDVVAALGDDSDVEGLAVLEELDGEALVRLEWNPTGCDLLVGLAGSTAVLLGAVGTDDSWSLRLRFPDRDRLGEFYRDCRTRGIDLSLRSVFPTGREGDRGGPLALTDVQRETLQAALELGYFDIPRRVTLVELADELGISDTAASQRLRRGVSTLAGTYVTEHDSRSPVANRP